MMFILLLALALTACTASTPEDSATVDPVPQETSESTTMDNSETIYIKAFQYGYEPGVINLKLNQPVQLILTTEDVSHGFLVKELGINETINPGNEVTIDIIPTETGEFDIICNVYCGSGHRDMKGKIVVTE